MAAKTVGKIQINLTAGTATFLADMDRANAKLRDFGNTASGAGHQAISELQATSAAVRVLEGGLTNNLRAAERFLASLPGVGTALKAIFPIVGGIAFAGILIKIGEEAKKAFDDIENGSKKAAQAFRTVGDSLKSNNDDLRIQNAQLDIQIAKLEGKRENTLALWLAEAQKAADSLADSLEKVVDQFAKIAKEQQVSVLRQIAGEAGTSDVTKMAQEDLVKLERINDDNLIRVNEAIKTGNRTAVAAAQEQWTKALQGYWETQRKYALKMLDDAEKAAKPTTYPAIINAASGEFEPEIKVPGINTDQLQNELKAYIARVVEPALTNVSLVPQVAKKKDAVAGLEADRAAAKLESPYDNKLDELRAKLQGINTEINAIGKGPAAEAIAVSMAEAAQAIEEVNKRLKELSPTLKLTADQETAIRDVELKIGEAAGTKEWKKQLESATGAVNERVRSETMLAGAIGKGFAATRDAAIETEVLSKVTAKYYDAANLSADQLAAIEKYRAAAAADFDSKHEAQVASAIKGLQEQMDLEGALAGAEADGAEVVRQLTLEYRLLELARNGATKEQIQLERDLANLQRENRSIAATAKSSTQIQGQLGVLAAIPKGSSATREAEVEARVLEMKQEGASVAEVENYRATEYLAIRKQILSEAYQGIYAMEDQVRSLTLQIDALRVMQDLGDRSVEINLRLKELENDRLKIAEQEQLALGGSKNALVAFFLEMEQQSNNAGQIMAKNIFDAMNNALDKVSDNLTKLITGQKTEWGKAFKDIGDNLLKSTIKTGLEKGLAAAGEHIPAVKLILDQIKGNAKPDGTAARPYHVVVDGQQGQQQGQQQSSQPGSPGFGNGGILGTGQVPTIGSVPVPPGAPGPSGAPSQFMNLLKSLFGQGGGASGAGGVDLSQGFGFLSSLGSEGASAGGDAVSSSISYMASGGDVTPGEVYMTGEHGMEPFIPGMTGHIMSHASAREAFGGGGHTYNIDARGSTDPYLTRQHVESALKAFHSSSVSMSVRANSERSSRTPSRSA